MSSDKENDILNKIPQLDDDNQSDKFSELEKEIQEIAKDQRQIIKTINRKSTIMIGIVAIIIIIVMLIITNSIPYSTISEHDFPVTRMSSGYVIENLKGEKINTFVSWKIEPNDPFHIHVINSPSITQEQLDMINDVIYSTDTVELTDGTYYKGWFGALQSSSYKTKFPIPIHYHSMITDAGSGHITIILTTQSSGDGYSGYTKNQVDEVNHQILKSQITIFSVDKLSKEEFKTVLRHELGHGFGLAHSQNPDDLMYPEIRTNHPYISPCDVQGIAGLYNGEQKSEIICQ
ncbi:MAG: matrixin family metalloprotease [Nitrosarchaeum sp.]